MPFLTLTSFTTKTTRYLTSSKHLYDDQKLDVRITKISAKKKTKNVSHYCGTLLRQGLP